MPITGNKDLKDALKKLSTCIIANKFTDQTNVGKVNEKPSDKIASVISEIEKIYKGKDDNKMNNLKNAFNTAKGSFDQADKCEEACKKIKAEINKNKKHCVGTQAAIVSWCDELIKELNKCPKAQATKKAKKTKDSKSVNSKLSKYGIRIEGLEGVNLSDVGLTDSDFDYLDDAINDLNSYIDDDF